MSPAVGDRVLYKLSDYDAKAVNEKRGDAHEFTVGLIADAMSSGPPRPGERGRTGHVQHAGNEVCEGDAYPADVVRTFGGTTVNLQVHLDGTDTYWATSRGEGDGPGQWSYPLLGEGAEQVSGTVGYTAPQVGEMVHYLSFGTPPKADGSQAYTSQCRAAFITELSSVEVNQSNPAGDGTFRPSVGLMVANPTGQFFARGVLFHEAADAITHPETCGGTWHPAGHA